jgi:hypothetical protein
MHSVETAWWDETKGDDAARKAQHVGDELVSRHAADQAWHTKFCIAFYDATQRPGGLFYRHRGSLGSFDGASQYNVIQSVVDTFTSHVIRNRVRLMFLTERGNRTERERARGMTQATEAAFDEAGLYGEEGTQVCRDGCRDGTGCIKVTPDYENSRVLLERCLRDEIFVDERDARLGKPRQMMHRQRIDRAVLLARFPKHAEAIRDADPMEYDTDGSDDLITVALKSATVAEQIEVREFWHLPSGRVDATKKESWGIRDKGSGRKPAPGHDGRHMIVIQSGTGPLERPVVLLDEPWPLPRFPIAFFTVKPRAIGLDGRGFVETLRHVQLQINKMLRRVDGIMQLHSVMTLYLNRAANVNPQQVATNDWSRILMGDMPANQAITHISPQSVPGDYIQQIDRLISWSFQMVGLSELTVHAERPKSMQSGAAVRTLLDTESIRHTDVFRAWEHFHQQLGKVVVDVFRLLAWNDSNFEVMWGSSKDLRVIKWKDTDLEDTKWKMGVWPTNLLPSTPGAKLEKVLELYREQAITREQLALLLDYPDMGAIASALSSGLRNIERRLEHAVRGDLPYEEYMPHGRLPLGLAHTTALQELNELEADEAEPEIVERVQQWLEDVEELMREAQPAAPPGAMAGGAPGAGAAPPPTQPGAPPLTMGGKSITRAGSEQVAPPTGAAA